MTPDSPPSALRRAVPDDAAALLALHDEAFDDERRPPPAEVVRILASPAETVWVLPGPGRLDGAVVLRRLGIDLHLRDLVTHPAARGQGVGRVLLAHAEAMARRDGARTMTVEAEEQDPRLVAWYESAGFERSGRIEDFFHAGCSAIRLRKAL